MTGQRLSLSVLYYERVTGSHILSGHLKNTADHSGRTFRVFTRTFQVETCKTVGQTFDGAMHGLNSINQNFKPNLKLIFSLDSGSSVDVPTWETPARFTLTHRSNSYEGF